MSHYPRIIVDDIAAATGDGVMIVGNIATVSPDDVYGAIETAQRIVDDERRGNLPVLSDAWRGGNGELAAIQDMTHEQFVATLRRIDTEP